MPKNHSIKVNAVTFCLIAAIFVCCAFEKASGQLIFSDDFSTTTLDPDKWISVSGQPLIDNLGINEPTGS